MTLSARSLRIVHLDTGRELRGGQRELLTLALGLMRRGHSQIIVAPEGSELETHGRREGFHVFSLPEHDPFHAHGVLDLRQLLESEPADILHAHDGRGQTLSYLASAGLAVRRVAARRVTFLPARGLAHRLKYTGTCHGVIAVSQFVRKLLIESGVPACRIEVIPDGVEIPQKLSGAEARARLRASWGWGDSEFVAGHLGAFTYEKGQDVALAARTLIIAKLPQFRLVLAGRGPLRDSPTICAGIQQAGDHMRVLDEIEPLADFFAALDLFIMPSRAEGLGSSVLLALAHGVPVVASRVGGLPEIVEESVTGWLVEPESAQALAEAVLEAQSDRERLAKYGSQARDRVRRFSNDIMIERTEAFYYRLLDC
jgi:glycosyltransferase involved in cell wall biosynthesis